MNSHWSTRPEFPGYRIKNDGTIVGLYNKNLKHSGAKGDYQTVVLYKEGKSKKFRVHRLIAEVFIPNPQGLPEVNHKDGVKDNNHVDNLEWVSSSANTKHKWDNGLGNHKQKGASSKYFGVCFVTKHQNWKAQVSYKGKKIFLGCYPTELEAAAVYDNYVKINNLPRPLNNEANYCKAV